MSRSSGIPIYGTSSQGNSRLVSSVRENVRLRRLHKSFCFVSIQSGQFSISLRMSAHIKALLTIRFFQVAGLFLGISHSCCFTCPFDGVFSRKSSLAFQGHSPMHNFNCLLGSLSISVWEFTFFTCYARLYYKLVEFKASLRNYRSCFFPPNMHIY